MTLAEVLEQLGEYLTTRDRAFKARKWVLADEAMQYFGHVNFDTFEILYNGVISLLWQQQHDFKFCQVKIRETVIKQALKVFNPDPLPGGPNTAWVLNNAYRGMYAPYKHVEAFLAGMKPCYVYVYGHAQPETIKDIETMGHTVRVVTGPATEKVAAIRALCEIDKIGTLIAETYVAIPLALFAMRSAPVQMYLSPGFQLFPADVVLVPETQDVMTWPHEIVPSPMRKETLFRQVERQPRVYPLVFGCLSRYEKLSLQYLETVAKILDQTGGTFLAFGRGTLPKIHERIIECGIVDPSTALNSMDVYLDTYPLCGGISVWEAMAAQVPVITMESESLQSWNRMKPYVVTSEEEYIEAAIEASKDNALRAHIIDEGLAQARKFIDVERAGRKLDGIIKAWHSQITATLSRQSQTGARAQM